MVFRPAPRVPGRMAVVELALDELEAMRLCDLLGLDQEEAGRRMGISRGTVQRLLSSARRKVADALIYGKALVIVGGPHIRFPQGLPPHGGRGGRPL